MDYHCDLCDSYMNDERMYEAHLSGKKHLKNTRKTPVERREQMRRCERADLEACINDDLDAVEGAVVGLSYIDENRKIDKACPPLYHCHLCGANLLVSDCVTHVLSTKHRLHYMKKVNPLFYELIQSTNTSVTRDSAVETQAYVEMNNHGRGKIRVFVERPKHDSYVTEPHWRYPRCEMTDSWKEAAASDQYEAPIEDIKIIRDLDCIGPLAKQKIFTELVHHQSLNLELSETARVELFKIMSDLVAFIEERRAYMLPREMFMQVYKKVHEMKARENALRSVKIKTESADKKNDMYPSPPPSPSLQEPQGAFGFPAKTKTEKKSVKVPISKKVSEYESVSFGRHGDQFFCQVCKAVMNTEEILEVHLQGKKHKRKLAANSYLPPKTLQLKASRGNKRFLKMLGGPKYYRVKKLNSSALILPKFQELKHVAVIGLNFVSEIHSNNQEQDLIYKCHLCASECQFTTVVAHVVGHKHRLNYMRLFSNPTYEFLKGMHKIDTSKLEKYACLAAKKDGCGVMSVEEVIDNGKREGEEEDEDPADLPESERCFPIFPPSATPILLEQMTHLGADDKIKCIRAFIDMLRREVTTCEDRMKFFEAVQHDLWKCAHAEMRKVIDKEIQKVTALLVAGKLEEFKEEYYSLPEVDHLEILERVKQKRGFYRFSTETD